MTYDEIKAEIKDMPMMWYPALLKTMIESAVLKGCFKIGRVGEFAKNVEEAMTAPNAHDIRSPHLSSKDRDIIDAAWLEFKAVKPSDKI